MKRNLTLLFPALFAVVTAFSQLLTPPPTYTIHIGKADSLYDLRDFKGASAEMNLAFKEFGWRGTTDARYKAARMNALAGNADSAFLQIERLAAQQYVNHLRIDRDSAFNLLRISNRKKFDSLLHAIELNKKKLAPAQNLEWTNWLEGVYDEDQSIRVKFQKIAMAKGWDSPEARAMLPAMRESDSINLLAITKFIDSHGWQGADVVGNRGNSTLFLVIQHADSVAQQKYLPLLRRAVAEKKARPADLALLEDRVMVDKYGYQIYGSQVFQDPVTKKMRFFPIRDEAAVEARRKEVGLQPLAEYARSFGIEYTPPAK